MPIRRRRHQGELGHFAAERGHDLLGRRGADAGQRRQPLGILSLDGVGDLAHRTDQRLDRFADADLVHGAEQLEELQLGLIHEADEPRHHPALHRVAVVIFTCVESEFLAGEVLHLPADELRHEHLVFERPNLQPHFLVQHAVEPACDAGNHRDPHTGSFWA